MTTLKDLKAEHPEWCFTCGAIFRDHYEVQHHEDANMCVKMSTLAALIAKALEDEARIKELTQRDPYWYDASPADAFRWWAEDRRALYAAQAEISELGKDAVPRSRYRAVEREVESANAKTREIQNVAHAEIDSLISQLTAEREAHEVTRKALEAKLAESEAKVKELNAQINSLGDAATDTFEQMLMGNWQDDHGHPVLNNTAMLALKSAVNDVLEARKKGAEHGE